MANVLNLQIGAGEDVKRRRLSYARWRVSLAYRVILLLN